MNYENLSLLQAVKKWPRVTSYSVCLAMNILLWGYDGAILSGVASMPAFQNEFGELIDGKMTIRAMWLSLWAVMFPVGSMIGAVICGWAQDKTGRRWTLLGGGVTSVLAITIAYLADITPNERVAFIFAKLLEGIAVGTIMTSTQTYLSEVVPARLRGPVFALFPILQLVGQLIATAACLGLLSVPGKQSYRIALASEYPLSAIPIALAFVLPESPVWLIRQDNISAARNSFNKLHGSKRSDEYVDQWEDMHKAVNEEKWAAQNRGATYIQCFQGANLRRTLIVLFANILPELFGLTLLGNASYFLQQAGMDHTMSFVIMILGVVLGLASNVGSFWTLLKFGRRLLINVTMAIITVVWGTIGISGCFGESTAIANYTAAGMMVVVVTAGLGAWPASYVVASETSSLRLRSKTSGLSWLIAGVVRCFFDLVFPYLYNKDAADLKSKTGFVYLATCAIGLVISYFYVPELKGRSIIEIDKMFEERLATRKFGGWQKVNDEDDGEPLRDTSSFGADRTEYDAGSLQGDKSLNVVPSASTGDSYEPLRKRPTF